MADPPQDPVSELREEVAQLRDALRNLRESVVLRVMRRNELHTEVTQAEERTEAMALKVLDAIAQEVGPENVEASLGFVGSQPSSYPVNTIYLWTSGPHEAVLIVSLKPERTMSTEALQEALRGKIDEIAPGAVVSFEAADLVNQVMSFGSPTPIEVAVTGANLTTSRGYAEKLKTVMAKVGALRDLHTLLPDDDAVWNSSRRHDFQ